MSSSTVPTTTTTATATTSVAIEDQVECIPNLKLAQLAFSLSRSHRLSQTEIDQIEHDLLQGIEKDEMAPWLQTLTSSSSSSSSSSPSTSTTTTTEPILKPRPDLLAKLQEQNRKHLQELEEKLKDAETNLGETEISDALKAKAIYLTRIGHNELAVKALETTLDKTAGKGSKIDLRLTIIRIGFFHLDHALIQTNIDKTQILVNEGGDWDRRNRLKAYEGLYLLSIRNFAKGGQLLLDTLSTFTATELIDYDDFVGLCVLSGAFMLDRKDLKKKIIEAPEVIALIPTMPSLKDYCESLWRCDYAAFFRSLATVEEEHFLPSRLLSIHARFYIREMRIKAYAQLLESYRSVTMKNLCQNFGVDQEFIDNDLARFIAAGRLNCSIDRVNEIVETNRPDAKNARYNKVIKQGDLVLTSVQRLSRVIG